MLLGTKPLTISPPVPSEANTMPARCSAGESREPQRLVHARRCNAAHSSYSPTPHLGPCSRGVYRSVVFCVHARVCVRVRVRVAGALARGEENGTKTGRTAAPGCPDKERAAALREQNAGVSPREEPRGHRRGACRSSQTCQSSHRLSAGAVRLDPTLTAPFPERSDPTARGVSASGLSLALLQKK